MERVVVFSHGFGVRGDSLGLFTEIATGLGRGTHPVMFDYGDYDAASATISLPPASKQAERLRERIDVATRAFPHLPVDIVAHSFGGLVTALAKPEGVRRIILLAPAWQIRQESADRMRSRPGVLELEDGRLSMSQWDGNRLLIPSDYMKEISSLRLVELFNDLAGMAQCNIIWAQNDKLVGAPPAGTFVDALPQEYLPGNHNFTGEARVALIHRIRSLLHT